MIFNIFKQKKTSPEVKQETSIFDRLKHGLQRTRRQFSGMLSGLLGVKKIDDTTRESLQHILLTSDVGVETADYILQETEQKLRVADESVTVEHALREVLVDLLEPSAAPWALPDDKPAVILFVGVNGSGKTTTIGRLGHALKASGKTVLLAAGDTFRAAAIDQLQGWGGKIDSPVVAHQQGADSAAVLFEAMQIAQADQIDVLLGDTAGRLHNQTNLMQELTKVKKVISKKHEAAPHEVWLVLDATVGQNGLRQAQQFKDAVGVTGVILTKLDGSAKGGIIFAISKVLRLPIRFVGVGEKASDLLPFDANRYVDALFDRDV